MQHKSIYYEEVEGKNTPNNLKFSSSCLIWQIEFDQLAEHVYVNIIHVCVRTDRPTY